MSAHHLFAPAAIIIAAALSAAPVSAQQWGGTWNTRFGEFRLIQSGDYVYGDYGEGTIEGIIDPRTRRLRARFVNPNGSTGYAELLIQPDNVMFAGAFRWENEALPTYEDSAPDRRWVGRRTSSTAPARTSVASGRTRAAFIASAPPKYRQWIGANTAASSSSATVAPPSTNALAERFPVLKDFPANFRPRFFEIRLISATFYGRRSEGTPRRPAEIYGTMGIYAYCETASATRALTPFGNVPNRVFDHRRERSMFMQYNTLFDHSRTTRRFALDETCLRDPDARISIQLQTNLNEKNSVPARDSSFGYRSVKYYLDNLTTQEKNKQFSIISNDIHMKLFPSIENNGRNIQYYISHKGEGLEIISKLTFIN